MPIVAKTSIRMALAFAMGLTWLVAGGCGKSNDPTSLPWDLTGSDLRADANAGVADVNKAAKWVENEVHSK